MPKIGGQSERREVAVSGALAIAIGAGIRLGIVRVSFGKHGLNKRIDVSKKTTRYQGLGECKHIVTA